MAHNIWSTQQRATSERTPRERTRGERTQRERSQGERVVSRERTQGVVSAESLRKDERAEGESVDRRRVGQRRVFRQPQAQRGAP